VGFEEKLHNIKHHMQAFFKEEDCDVCDRKKQNPAGGAFGGIF
jgi:hypothetical protein